MPGVKMLPLSEVKNNFSRIVEAVADRDERVMITRNGRPAAILMNPDQLRSLIATLDVLSDLNMMKQIKQSERDLAAGRYRDYGLDELDELFGET